MEYERMREVSRMMRGAELPGSLLPLIDALIDRCAELDARATAAEDLLDLMTRDNPAWRTSEAAAHVRELVDARRPDLKRHREAVMSEELEQVRALGQQAKQAADERREELEKVIGLVWRGGAYAPGRALEAATFLRNRALNLRDELDELRGRDGVGAGSVVLPRACVAELVNALEGAWWVKAAAALSRMSDALIVEEIVE